MRLIFLGSPQFAVPSLAALLEAGHDVGLVVTQPDRPAGRGRQLAPPPVAEFARERGLPLLQTSTLKGAEIEAALRRVDAEGMALAAFAALVPRNVLDLTAMGVLNVHPSLLPRWRGASPIQSALLAGDRETGVSIIRLVKEMDAGPIVLQRRVPIQTDDDYLSLEGRLSRLGADLLVEALDGLIRGSLEPQPQSDQGVTYCARIDKEDGRIDWSRATLELCNQVRAYRGWPQAFTTMPDGSLLKVLSTSPVERNRGTLPGVVIASDGQAIVTTGDGALSLDQVVPAGRRPQTGAELLRGHPSLVGARLGAADS